MEVFDGSGVTDTQLLAARAFPGQSTSLDNLVSRLLPEIAGYKAETERLTGDGIPWYEMPREEVLKRNALDVYATRRIREILEERLSEEELSWHEEDVKHSLCLARMQDRGIHVDLLPSLGRRSRNLRRTGGRSTWVPRLR